MQKFAVVLAYDGTPFWGWQRQDASRVASEGATAPREGPLPAGARAVDAPSIQAELERALRELTGESPSVVGSGRTDSGVHALGQVAHFRLGKREWEPRKLRLGLEARLPESIKPLRVLVVPPEFHAQRSALKKQYGFYFLQSPAPVPHLQRYSWWIRRPLDLAAMAESVQALVGERDFNPFRARGAVPGSTVRRILEAEVTRLGGGEVSMIRLRIVGTGFLKQMVRGIAGTLLEVGEGRRPPTAFAEILAAQDRDLVGSTAKARGLWLERVWYPPEFGLEPTDPSTTPLTHPFGFV